LNLFWLKYVSYAFLAGAAFFYFALRLNRLPLRRATQLILYAVCIVLACVAWHVQESNSDRYSPRRLIIGTVTSVNENGHKSGSIDDDFQLQFESGSRSPEFSTDIVADRADKQPIHRGDLLGVLYRTWDNVPLTIDEIQGQHVGWRYKRSDDGDAYIFGVSAGGLVGFIGAFAASRNRRAQVPSPVTALHINE
jgi:hypothetical protein